MKRSLAIVFIGLLSLQPGMGKNKLQIGLIPSENIDKEAIHLAVKKIEGYFNAKVVLTKRPELPKKFEKDTINVNALIQYFENELLLLNDKNIYLTDQGIALNDNASYSVRGLAKLGGRIGVVSTLVVKHEAKTKREYLNLLAKVVVHETAHLFGLGHCMDDDKCVLVSSLPNPRKFYSAERMLCRSCLGKIDDKLIRRKYREPKF
ncbi:MAG: hypothetical protein MJA30_27090 [Cytophagales bacterium]|nr:hypothetical protein [Cytophagales bacterium]